MKPHRQLSKGRTVPHGFWTLCAALQWYCPSGELAEQAAAEGGFCGSWRQSSEKREMASPEMACLQTPEGPSAVRFG